MPARSVINIATLPSFSGDELPAVPAPFSENTEGSEANFSSVPSARIDSSLVTSPNGTTKPSCNFLSHAAAANWCERCAHSSCACLEILNLSATSSEHLPKLAVQCAGNNGFVSRQPTVD